MIVLTDKHFREQLFPFTHTRHAADIRIGILTIREKWEWLTGETVSIDETDHGLQIPANIIPTPDNFESILHAAGGHMVTGGALQVLGSAADIFLWNDTALRNDFKLITANRQSTPLSPTNKAIEPGNIFMEHGAVVEYSILNASTGPIYIGKNAVVMEGNMIRGPFSLGENSTLKMGSKIYGATTIGPNCVVGGEIKNSVLFGNSNKAHDGYLGDSVIGEWCNLGAGTCNSNVKNTGGPVRLYFGKGSEVVDAGNKAGLLMGDYSRAAINTSLNTGTVVGVCCNIFGEKMPAKFTENFTWGDERYIFDKAIIDIGNWKQMKGQQVSNEEVKMLRKLYDRDD
ncbi:MAG: putative sugar nucleotidyl transferase [Ferruginibacter sp.]